MGKILNVSIVLYNTEFAQIANLVKILKTNTCINHIYLVDNSPLRNTTFENSGVDYMFTGKNIGFGTGHNLAIQKSINDEVRYHLVLNSDISFDISVLNALLQKMEINSDIGVIMPKILNLDGSIQLLPKLLPTPFNLLIRVISPLRIIFNSKNKVYTLEKYLETELNVPIISGCFSLFRVEVLKKIGLYDERFFMYIEDFDLSRRIHSRYKTIYYPTVSIIHAHERGASKSFKLFVIFIKSAIIYFNKYGWFFDRDRKIINKSVLNQIKNKHHYSR